MSTYINVDDYTDSEFRSLVIGAKEREVTAFETIYQLLSDRLFAYALSHTSSRDDALDTVQETFIEL